jgi:hypothetical protein
VSEKKYSVTSMGPRIDSFLKPLLQQAGFQLKYEVAEGESGNPVFRPGRGSAAGE